MSTPALSIRFPFTREKTGNRRGPRFRRVVDCDLVSKTQSPSAACAVRMISSAMRYQRCWLIERDNTTLDRGRIARLQMREMALWARLFARQISKDDPRLEAARAASHAAVQAYCRSVDQACTTA